MYHKLYNQIYSHASVVRGMKFEASVIVRGVEAAASNWKAAAKALAAETKQRFEAGEIHF